MYKKLINETIIYGIGAIMPRIIVFILNPYYIHEFRAEEFAVFTNLYALISYVNIVLTFGFETAFFRFAAEKGNKSITFNTAYVFLAANALIFLLINTVFSQPIAHWLHYEQTPEYIRWFGWIAFFDTLCVIPFAWLRFNNRPIRYSIVRVSSSLIQTLAVLLLFLAVPADFSASLGLKSKVAFPFISNLLGSLLSFALLLPIAMKVRFHFNKDLFSKMIRYAFPIMLAGFAFMVNENFDKAVQRFVIPEGDAGAYGGCYKLAVLMTLFVTAYRLGVEPFFFKQMKNDNAKITYARVTEYFVIIAGFIALGIIANIGWLKALFIRDQTYWVAIDIVPIIVVSYLFFGVYYNLSTWYKVSDRTQFGTYISWGGAGVTILLNLFLLPTYGFMVSAWATLAAYFFMAVLSFFLGQKYYPIPYRKRKILFYLILSIGFSTIAYVFLNANFWAGNFFLVSYAALAYFIEKKSLSLDHYI